METTVDAVIDYYYNQADTELLTSIDQSLNVLNENVLMLAENFASFYDLSYNIGFLLVFSVACLLGVVMFRE